MNILLCMAESPDGCTWYRVSQFAQTAKRLGLCDHKWLKWSLSESEIATLITAADVYLLRLNDQTETIVKSLKKNPVRKPIILDIDDKYEDINPLSDHYRYLGTDEVTLGDGSYLWQAGVGEFDPKANAKRLASFERVMGTVDAIITTTLKLRTYALQFNPNVVVIPNCIDPHLFPDRRPSKDTTIRIVWSGGSSHYEDLAVIKPVLKEILTEFPQVEYHHVGQGFKGILKDLPEKRVFTYRWLPPEAHGYRLVTIGADIGLCPLERNAFNTYKSSVKHYEYAGAGMVTVARNIEPYTEDITHGKTGVLYEDNDDLKTKLVELITDPLKRASVADAARKDVLARRSVEKVTKDWCAFLAGTASVMKGGHERR